MRAAEEQPTACALGLLVSPLLGSVDERTTRHKHGAIGCVRQQAIVPCCGRGHAAAIPKENGILVHISGRLHLVSRCARADGAGVRVDVPAGAVVVHLGVVRIGRVGALDIGAAAVDVGGDGVALGVRAEPARPRAATRSVEVARLGHRPRSQKRQRASQNQLLHSKPLPMVVF